MDADGAFRMRRVLACALVLAGVVACALLTSKRGRGDARHTDLMQEDSRLRAVKVSLCFACMCSNLSCLVYPVRKCMLTPFDVCFTKFRTCNPVAAFPAGAGTSSSRRQRAAVPVPRADVRKTAATAAADVCSPTTDVSGAVPAAAAATRVPGAVDVPTQQALATATGSRGSPESGGSKRFCSCSPCRQHAGSGAGAAVVP